MMYMMDLRVALYILSRSSDSFYLNSLIVKVIMSVMSDLEREIF